jgi:hypothetical protein
MATFLETTGHAFGQQVAGIGEQAINNTGSSTGHGCRRPIWFSWIRPQSAAGGTTP